MINVRLRYKPMTKGRESLYLDFYPAVVDPLTGEKSRRDFLRLYVYKKPKTEAEREHNKETKILAEHRRLKKYNEVNKPEIYSDAELKALKQKENEQRSFIGFFEDLCNKRKSSNHDNWISAGHYLKAFAPNKLTFGDLTEKFCNDFKLYLLNSPRLQPNRKGISQNSALSYFNKFKAALKQAYKDGYLQENLNDKIECIKPLETKRNFLTIAELNKLASTDFDLPVMKRAAVFSALTGLRYGDIKRLRWSQVECINDQGYFISFRQQKTKGVELQPISNQAYDILGAKGEPDQLIFDRLKYSNGNNKKLAQWVKDAGITKHITFHCFRHTYATLLISHGTDLYTVSKMLGHREIKTTQIYAKVLDVMKREAANKIQLHLNS